MHLIIIFIIVAIAVSLAGVFMNPDTTSVNLPEETNQEEQVSPSGSYSGSQSQSGGSTKTTQPTQTTVDPNFPINSYIKYGPIKEEVLNETNKFVFEFDAVISGSVNKNDVYFETKVTGLDSAWVKESGKEREVIFPAGVKEYTFWVRARTNTMTEPSPASRTIKINISPYFGKVDIYDVDPPDVYANPSLIKLRTNISGSEYINLTGWTLTGEKSYLSIPQGIKKYTTGAQSLENIYIQKGDTVYVSSKASPFGNSKPAYRINKCLGYLNNSYSFPITVQNRCPRPEANKLSQYLSTDCKNYILSLGTCEESTYNGLAEYDLLKDEYCKGYLEARFNYAGCLSYYSGDSDFYLNEWHIYTNRENREIMHPTEDTIYLKDQNGLFIDKYCFGESC